MALVLPNEGLPTLLDQMIRDLASGFVDWEMMLFVNNITPDQDTVYADLTEATFGNYSRITIDHTLWEAPTVVADHAVSTYTTTPQIWTVTSGSETVYGYALVTVSSPIIIVVERFASPVAVSAGGVLAVLPRITLTTEP